MHNPSTDIYFNNNFGPVLAKNIKMLSNKKFETRRTITVLLGCIFAMIYAVIPIFLPDPFSSKIFISIFRLYGVMTAITWVIAELHCSIALYSTIKSNDKIIEDNNDREHLSLMNVYANTYKRLFAPSLLIPYELILIIGFLLRELSGLKCPWYIMLPYFIGCFIIYYSILSKILPDKNELLKDTFLDILHNDVGEDLIDCNAIVARNSAGFIGKGGRLMYKLPKDMKTFKERTLHNIVIMGRRTYESMGYKPLKDRVNIVVSFSDKLPNTGTPTCHAVKTPLEALALAYSLLFRYESRDITNKIWVIGGTSVYYGLMNRTKNIYLTHIVDHAVGDRKFSFPEDEFDGYYMSGNIMDNGYSTYITKYVRKFEDEPDEIVG